MINSAQVVETSVHRELKHSRFSAMCGNWELNFSLFEALSSYCVCNIKPHSDIHQQQLLLPVVRSKTTPRKRKETFFFWLPSVAHEHLCLSSLMSPHMVLLRITLIQLTVINPLIVLSLLDVEIHLIPPPPPPHTHSVYIITLSLVNNGYFLWPKRKGSHFLIQPCSIRVKRTSQFANQPSKSPKLTCQYQAFFWWEEGGKGKEKFPFCPLPSYG